MTHEIVKPHNRNWIIYTLPYMYFDLEALQKDMLRSLCVNQVACYAVPISLT